MKKHCVLWVFVACFSLITPAGRSLLAQPQQLDHATMIESLSREGMSELLDRLAEDLPNDPVLNQLVKIGRFRIQMGDTRLDQEQHLAAFNQLVEATRKLIADHTDHEQRPVWQTDLAEIMLTDYLLGLHGSAAEFYEFGETTGPQHEAFESVVAEALEHLIDADLRFYLLQAELPREPDHEEKRVNTGLWDRMMSQYYRTKTQLYLAHAAYYTALLDDQQPYYRDLGSNPKIPRQANTIDQERSRLLELALDRLGPLMSDAGDPYQIRWPAKCLAGRAMAHQSGGEDRAIPELDAVINQSRADLNELLAHLAKAVVRDKQGRHPAAMDQLANLTGHPIVGQYPLYRLLIVDQMHRLLVAEAQKEPDSRRAAAIARAYQPYEDMLADPALGSSAGGFRHHVYTRWRNAITSDDDIISYPPIVIRAVGEISRIEGQNLMIESDQLFQEDQEQLALDLAKQALPKLEHAIQINTKLLERQDLTRVTRAEAMYNLGLSKYFWSQGDTDVQVEAAKIWADVADQMSDQAVAEDAINNAIAILRQMYDSTPRPPGVADAYEHTGRVLFEKFPTSETADNERNYFAFHVLTGQGLFEEAVEVLRKVPSDHPIYFEARREMLLNLKEIFDRAEKPVDRQAAQKQLEDVAMQVRRDTQGREEESESIKKAAGWARLMLVDVAIAREDTDEALSLLEGFDRAYQNQPILVAEALSRAIMALARVGQFERAVARAKQMMQMFPDDAAAVIDGVLENLDRRVDFLRKAEEQTLVQSEKKQFNQEKIQVSQTAKDLAQLLLHWANQQGLEGEDLLPYEMILAKAMTLAEEPQGAIVLLRPLLEEHPQNPEVIHQLGESLFATGDPDAMIEAGNRMYDQLIAGLEQAEDPYLKRLWWNAWMRRLQISDRINQGTEDIALRVRQLEGLDKSLGGEPFHSEFRRLANKHALGLSQ